VAAERSWQREFDDPIEAPDGTRLNTLREAVACLAKTVPKVERDLPAVTTAAEMPIYAAECGIAWMFLARMQARVSQGTGFQMVDTVHVPRTYVHSGRGLRRATANK
jgi:hypothetical protein